MTAQQMTMPWETLAKGAMRMVLADSNVLWWAKDPDNRFEFIIEFESRDIADVSNINLSGMTIVNNSSDNLNRIIFVLNDIDNVELFYTLCTNFVSLVQKYSDRLTASIILNRLKSWQNFLLKGRNNVYPVEKQIGLFGELSFLYSKLFPIHSIEKSVNAWVGPDRDKQDFRFNSLNVEVKTYSENKRGLVHISSLEQLNPTNGDLFLYAYGVKLDEKGGMTIQELANRIEKEIINSDESVLFRFEELLSENGFFEFADYDNLKSFTVFEENVYIVNNDFPKLDLDIKKNAIKTIKYDVDLTLCDEFLIDTNAFVKILKDNR